MEQVTRQIEGIRSAAIGRCAALADQGDESPPFPARDRSADRAATARRAEEVGEGDAEADH